MSRRDECTASQFGHVQIQAHESIQSSRFLLAEFSRQAPSASSLAELAAADLAVDAALGDAVKGKTVRVRPTKSRQGRDRDPHLPSGEAPAEETRAALHTYTGGKPQDALPWQVDPVGGIFKRQFIDPIESGSQESASCNC